jgi:hypothetical protein
MGRRHMSQSDALSRQIDDSKLASCARCPGEAHTNLQLPRGPGQRSSGNETAAMVWPGRRALVGAPKSEPCARRYSVRATRDDGVFEPLYIPCLVTLPGVRNPLRHGPPRRWPPSHSMRSLVVWLSAARLDNARSASSVIVIHMHTRAPSLDTEGLTDQPSVEVSADLDNLVRLGRNPDDPCARCGRRCECEGAHDAQA